MYVSTVKNAVIASFLTGYLTWIMKGAIALYKLFSVALTLMCHIYRVASMSCCVAAYPMPPSLFAIPWFQGHLHRLMMNSASRTKSADASEPCSLLLLPRLMKRHSDMHTRSFRSASNCWWSFEDRILNALNHPQIVYEETQIPYVPVGKYNFKKERKSCLLHKAIPMLVNLDPKAFLCKFVV